MLIIKLYLLVAYAFMAGAALIDWHDNEIYEGKKKLADGNELTKFDYFTIWMISPVMFPLLLINLIFGQNKI